MNNIPKIQDADLKGKVILIRVDHNVVKKGKIKDPYRIDASLETIKMVFEKGGKPILMSHVGRPKNKKTGEIEISEKTAVGPIVDYLNNKLGKVFKTPEILEEHCGNGYENLEMINPLLEDLRNDKLDGIYLPNTRCFTGEESGGEVSVEFGKKLSNIADIYINDAFGSWQPHASTIEPTKYLPSFAGVLMQKEIANLDRVLNPERPLLAVVAGSKFDTKIGPLSSLLQKADFLILGGVIYNAYLCAKYKIRIKGVSEDDIKAAENFLKISDQFPGKIVELPYIIESDLLEEKSKGNFRVHNIHTLKPQIELNYILDVSQRSFAVNTIRDIFKNARTIFVNAVMGYTPNFSGGTIALNKIIDENTDAAKLFGGGDTLQEFKTLLPEIYKKALPDDKYYFFTGGGTILKAIKENSATGLEPVQALIVNKKSRMKERRNITDRRQNQDRRKITIPVKIERRNGRNRRNGIDRRSKSL